ncbi:MAG: enoyl-CoA hydratase/isomerase family protein [Planctomycetota bacterium]
MNKSDAPVRSSLEEGGALLRLTLSRPNANILDTKMVDAIRSEISSHASAPGLRTVLFDSEGKHFSFGASVEEHRPGEVDDMLPGFHAMFRELAKSGKVLLAAVTGMCLGGGLELVSFCHRIFARPGSQFGNPEIKLGVFAPLASVVLPHRVGQPAADDMLLSGRNVGAEEALSMRLIDELADEPKAAALNWHRDHLAPLSARALFHAVAAARLRLHRDLDEALNEVERRYLEDLMATHDAPEGINAFLEKRPPVWQHQ